MHGPVVPHASLITARVPVKVARPASIGAMMGGWFTLYVLVTVVVCPSVSVARTQNV
jgi:hypothetical protein